VARNKFALTGTYTLSDHWKAGIEFATVGRQYLDSGTFSKPYVITAAMVMYQVKKWKFVLNGENLFDVRQSNFSPLVTGEPTQPVFHEIWAPLEGRVINFSVNVRI
jgi:outer membrane receptor protein involved in Fe transport